MKSYEHYCDLTDLILLLTYGLLGKFLMRATKERSEFIDLAFLLTYGESGD